MQEKIKRDLIKGMSVDAIISKYANKKVTNTDNIRAIIKSIMWKSFINGKRLKTY